MTKKITIPNALPVIKKMALNADKTKLMTDMRLQRRTKIRSEIQRLSTLSGGDYYQCLMLFFRSSTLLQDDSAAGKQRYFNDIFIRNAHEHAYIDVCKIRNDVVSFVCFELFDSRQTEIGNSRVTHSLYNENSPVSMYQYCVDNVSCLEKFSVLWRELIQVSPPTEPGFVAKFYGVCDEIQPVWKLFGTKYQPENWADLRWYELAGYPLEEWRDFVFAKSPDEREKYFDHWDAPACWRECFDSYWYSLFYESEAD